MEIVENGKWKLFLFYLLCELMHYGLSNRLLSGHALIRHLLAHCHPVLLAGFFSSRASKLVIFSLLLDLLYTAYWRNLVFRRRNLSPTPLPLRRVAPAAVAAAAILVSCRIPCVISLTNSSCSSFLQASIYV